MTSRIIITAISIAVLIAVIAGLYFLAKRNERKRDEQQASIDQMAQNYNMLIIDKKKLRLKESGLPSIVIEKTPWYGKLGKVPIVKAKVGPKIMTFVADNQIFDVIPVKKEVKATVSGIYITDVRGIRGPLEKPVKKKNFFSRLMGVK